MVSTNKGLMFLYILSLLHDFGGVYENYAWHLLHPSILHDTLLSKRWMFFLVAVMFSLFAFLRYPPPLYEV